MISPLERDARRLDADRPLARRVSPSTVTPCQRRKSGNRQKLDTDIAA
jgi:hypothetical protein